MVVCFWPHPAKTSSHTLEQCEAAGMRVGASISEAGSLLVKGGSQPVTQEFKNFRILVMSDAKRECGIYGWISLVAAVLCPLSRSVAAKQELNHGARFMVGWSVYIPVLINGRNHKATSISGWNEVSPWGLLHSLSLIKWGVQRSGRDLKIVIVLSDWELRWFGHLLRMPPGLFPRGLFWVEALMQTRDTLDRLYLPAGWGHLWMLRSKLDSVVME